MAEICPIPHVGHSLEPYIHPRSTVSSIRQSLHSHLERQLRLEATQTLSLVNVSDPPLTQTLPEPPASVTGVRRAYWRALRAHQVARERYEGLRAELDVAAKVAGEGSASASSSVSSASAGGGDGQDGELLLLLKARERRRRLGAVEKAVEAVEREGKGVVGAKVDDVVKRSVGDVPVFPSQRGVASGGGGGREEGEMRMVELKKAILGAKATIEKSKGEKPLLDDVKPSSSNELLALQQSRNELIGWIEKQLSLIGDAQAEDNNNDASSSSSPTKNSPHPQENPNPILTNSEITQLYDHYLSARSTLLSTLQEPQDISPLAATPTSPHQPPTPGPENDPATSTAATLLPYITPLLSTASSEADAIHQSAYIRRQLSSADAASERLLRRLADESHLVHPGTSRGRDWGRAGEEAGEATRDFVLARARAGEVSSKEAEGLVRRIGGVTEGMERLVRE